MISYEYSFKDMYRREIRNFNAKIFKKILNFTSDKSKRKSFILIVEFSPAIS